MWQALLIVATGLTILLLGKRAWGRMMRDRALKRLGDAERLRETRGVRIAGLLTGAPPISGMNPARRNIMTGDLVLTADRFVLASNRGLLADVGPDHGRPFTSVRCPGPGRLVIEGDIPLQEKPPGLFRFEIAVDDAVEWAKALQPFVDAEASKHFVTARELPLGRA